MTRRSFGLFILEKLKVYPLDTAIFSNRKFIYVKKVALFFKKLVDALICFKDAGIVHADIKPRNIYVSNNFEPILIDFGISSTTHKKAIPKGTLNFASPEILKALENDTMIEYNEKIDVFSFGITFYYAIYKIPPFRHRLRVTDLLKAEVSFPIKTRSSLAKIIRFCLCESKTRINLGMLREALEVIIVEKGVFLLEEEYKFVIGDDPNYSEPPTYSKNKITDLIKSVTILILVLGFLSFGVYMCCKGSKININKDLIDEIEMKKEKKSLFNKLKDEMEYETEVSEHKVD